jgi:hypothetical protein
MVFAAGMDGLLDTAVHFYPVEIVEVGCFLSGSSRIIRWLRRILQCTQFWGCFWGRHGTLLSDYNSRTNLIDHLDFVAPPFWAKDW